MKEYPKIEMRKGMMARVQRQKDDYLAEQKDFDLGVEVVKHLTMNPLKQKVVSPTNVSALKKPFTQFKLGEKRKDRREF